MPQPKAASPEWTKNHELALSGLTGTLGIPKKEARSFLEGMPAGDVAEMMRQALAARTRSQAPPALIPDGPSGAVPLHPEKVRDIESSAVSPQQPTRAIQPQPMARPAWQKPGPQPVQQSTPIPPPPPGVANPAQQQRGLLSRIFGRKATPAAAAAMMRMNLPATRQPQAQPIAAPSGPIKAPIGPAAAQTQPAPQGLPPVKPRVQVRAAGQRIPPAPIGPAGTTEEPEAPAQTKEKAAPLPLIRTVEEYNQLPPGTEFIWKMDSHVYEKPAETAQKA